VGDERPVSRHGQGYVGRRLPVDPDRPSSTEPSGPPTSTDPQAPQQASRRRAPFHPGTIAVIALGGAAGTLGRVELGRLIPTTTNGFPWPTFAANITGAFVIGLVIVLVLDRMAPTRYVRPLIGTGFCGGLTTFSTLVVEIDLLVKAGHAAMALGYLAASLAAGMAAVWAGMALARVPTAGRRSPTGKQGGQDRGGAGA
jgi:CrcB protein